MIPVEREAPSDPKRSCARCRGESWVCENHSSEPQGHDDACNGAGAPCPDCNPLASDHSRALAEVERLRALLRETVQVADVGEPRPVRFDLPVPRRADTPEAREIWAGVEKAAENCPEWAREQVREAARADAERVKEAAVVWFIERGQPEGQVPTMWWSSNGRWTTDANEAIPFDSKADADAVIENRSGVLLRQRFGRATEHTFVRAALRASPSATSDANQPYADVGDGRLAERVAWMIGRPDAVTLIVACKIIEEVRNHDATFAAPVARNETPDDGAAFVEAFDALHDTVLDAVNRLRAFRGEDSLASEIATDLESAVEAAASLSHVLNKGE